MPRSTQVARFKSKKRTASSAAFQRKTKRAKWNKNSFANYDSSLSYLRPVVYGFPDKLRTRIKYADTIMLSAANPNNVFRLNSLYDPDLTNIGHQPQYFDQLCGAANTPYNKYRVLGSKLTVTFTSRNAPALAAQNYAPTLVYAQNAITSTLVYSTAQQILEASGAATAILGDKSGGNNMKTLTQTYSPTRDLGVDMGDDSVSAAYNTNPSSTIYCHIGKFDQGMAGDIQIYVTIDYFVEFFQRNEVNSS